MWWFCLMIFIALIVVFSRAEECYECGSRDPSVYTAGKTKALCDKCWVDSNRTSDS